MSRKHARLRDDRFLEKSSIWGHHDQALAAPVLLEKQLPAF